jgi:hypothetical protein
MDQTTSASPTCAHCAKPATLYCSACKAAPVYDEKEGVENENVRYWTAQCQKLDWVKHKGLCKALKERKAFFRLDSLLQEMFYMYREKVFDRPVARLEEKDGKLFIHEADGQRL